MHDPGPAAINTHHQAIEAALAARFDDAWPLPFRDVLQYPIFSGGKRVRPVLTLLAYEAVGGDDVAAALPAAVAVELVHTYSLVHDDLPAMDDDDVRRGRPTVHRAFGDAAAILCGDALLTEAFCAVVEGPQRPAVRIAMVRRLAEASGYRGMVGGQAADVGLGGPIRDLDALVALHRGKTGALLAAAAVLGGYAAEADDGAMAALEAYGAAVGLAFQLADDVLDADEDADDDGPPSYVKLLGVDATRARAQALRDEAIAAARRLRRPEGLVALARFVVDRDH